MYRLFAPLSLALCLSAAVAAPSFAGDYRLAVGDLDFARPADLQTFQSRLTVIQDLLCNVPAVGSRIPAGQAACRAAVEEEAALKLPPVQAQAYAAAKASQPGHSALASRD